MVATIHTLYHIFLGTVYSVEGEQSGLYMAYILHNGSKKDRTKPPRPLQLQYSTIIKNDIMTRNDGLHLVQSLTPTLIVRLEHWYIPSTTTTSSSDYCS